MIKSFQLRIKGVVQGVFFRVSTRDKAKELKVCGFVKNEKDGSVYAEIEGEEGALGVMLDWCKQGPREARVEEVKVIDQPIKGYLDFEIRRD